MIISHKHKFAFFAIPRCGSKTAEMMLRLTNVFGQDDILSKTLLACFEPASDIEFHTTPSEAVTAGYITIEQLKEYRAYAFLRDPKKRWVSQARQRRSRGYNPAFWGCLGRPQSDYFMFDGKQVLTPLFFDNYEDELRSLISTLPGNQFDMIPVLNRAPEGSSTGFPAKKLMQDIDLYRRNRDGRT